MERPALRKMSLKIEALIDVQLSPGEPRKDLKTHSELFSPVFSL
jgi:hypothetical protein